MTERVVVAFDKLGNSHNQFTELPPSYHYKGIEFLIHASPSYLSIGEEVVANYDLCLTGLINTHQGDKEQHNPRTVTIERKDKYRTAQELRSIKKNLNLQHMVVPPVFGPYTLDDFSFHAEFAKGRYVTKPLFGARGLGIYLVDARKVGLKNILIPLSEWIEDITEERTPPKAVADLTPFPDKLVPYVKEINRDENEEVEFEKSLRNQGGFIIEEYVENIISEYRIIAYKGKARFVGKRQRNDMGKSHDSDLLVQEHLTELNPKGIEEGFYPDVKNIQEILDEVEKVLGRLPKDVISADLFITKEGKWGLFEFCSQFGTRFVPAAPLLNVYKDYIYDQWMKIKE